MSSHKTWLRASSPISLEGAGYKPVPLDCFLAQVKIFQAEGDATQVAVLTQILSTEHV